MSFEISESARKKCVVRVFTPVICLLNGRREGWWEVVMETEVDYGDGGGGVSDIMMTRYHSAQEGLHLYSFALN